MKILRLPAYFFPEQMSSTHLQLDRLEVLSEKGYEIEVFTPIPTRGVSQEVYESYKNKPFEEMFNGKVKVHRFPLMRERSNPIARAYRYLLSNIKQFRLGIAASGISVIYSSSTPPTQGLLCAAVRKRLQKKYGKRIPIVYNLQDIFPDSLVNAGLAKKGGLIWKIGRVVENKTYQRADKIIVISNSMKTNLLEKGVPEKKIEVVSNWIDINRIKPVSKSDNLLYDELGIDKTKFTVLYAGNIGEIQGAEIILDVARAFTKESNVQFVVFGGGSQFIGFRKEAGSLPNIKVFDLLPQERISEVYSLGDVALITCKPGTGKAGLPSKTWSIMACNTPIIASFDVESDLAEILKSADAGICIEPGNKSLLTEAITEMMEKHRTCENAREYVIHHASKGECVQRYADIIEDAVNSSNNWKDSSR